MRWYVSPRFAAKAAAWAAKIDAALAELAALLNGGLDLGNLKPGTQFPLGAFNEPASLVLLRGSIADIAWDVNLGGPVPVAGEIVALGIRSTVTPWGQDVELKVNGVTRATVTVTTGRLTQRFDPPIAVAAGETVSLTLEVGGESGSAADAVVALRVPHVV